MVIIGAGMNHWYHQDMNYRSIINFLMMCGTVGVSGGGWAHYVGQEKLRPQTGWTMLAFALDWVRPPRHMNGTSFFYAHSDQWRYEKLDVSELLSPLADPAPYRGSMIDLNVRAERMGWLPSAPQLAINPLTLAAEADRAGVAVKDHVVAGLKSGTSQMSCEDPDNPVNFPRNLFIWRSNLFGSSGKGHEYFLRHFLGTRHGLQGKDLGEMDGMKPRGGHLARSSARGQARSRRHARLPHVDELSLFRRRAADCDLVREERPQHLRHASVHPSAVDGGGSGLGIAQRLGDLQDHREALLGTAPEAISASRRDVVLTPIQHDTPAELAQPFEVKDWKKGECDLDSRRHRAADRRGRARLSQHLSRFTALGPLADKLGNGGKGIGWNTEDEVEGLAI